MFHYSHCPVCASSDIRLSFSAKDYTVSNEQFPVWKCGTCTLLFTQDIPVQSQIGKYYKSENYISHSNTQKGIINKLYHLVRKRTLKQKRKLVESETSISKGNMLDIGCGTGAFLRTMKEAGWTVTGLEPDEQARQIALTVNKVHCMNPELLFSLPEKHFDAVTAWHVMEHVHTLHEYVLQLKHIIKENGRLFIAVPNYTSYDAAHYAAYWAAYDVPRHLYHFSPKSMSVLMEKHGMKVEKILPMWFDSFYVSMLSQQYKNNSGNMIKAFITGLISNLKAVRNKAQCSSVIYVVKQA
ncbi:MAG: class I SAM-dependent methyltransferase [Bacteroidetes bacterium]|nr:class I SAM-dependent methyltransferase [Bacteroidota bacterium]